MVKSLLIALALGFSAQDRATKLEEKLYQAMIPEEYTIIPSNPNHSLCYREPLLAGEGYINIAADDYFETEAYPDVFSVIVFDQEGEMSKHFMDYSPAGIGLEDEVYDRGLHGLTIQNGLNPTNVAKYKQEFLDLLEEASYQ